MPKSVLSSRDAKKMIVVEIRGGKLSLCQVRNRSVQTGGSMGHRNLLATSFTAVSWFTKQITKFVKRKFQGRSKKISEVTDWSFEVSIQSFIFNFEVSDQSFEVRTRINRFDYKCLVVDSNYALPRTTPTKSEANSSKDTGFK